MVWLALTFSAAVLQPALPLPRGSSSIVDELPRPPVARPDGSGVDRAIAAGEYERAARLLASEIERSAAPRPLLLRIATVFLMDRRPLNAAVALKKAETLAPLEPSNRLQLALAYVAMRRPDWARPELERLAADDPGQSRYAYWLARLDYDAGQYAQAIARLQMVVEREPLFARAHDNLALCYEAQHRVEEALRHYREAVRLARSQPDQRSPWPMLNLGILLAARGETAEAETLWREALTFAEEFPQAHYRLGLLQEQQGRFGEAIASLTRAATLDDTFAEPHYALARLHRRRGALGQADRAMRTFQQLQAAARAGTTP